MIKSLFKDAGVLLVVLACLSTLFCNTTSVKFLLALTILRWSVGRPAILRVRARTGARTGASRYRAAPNRPCDHLHQIPTVGREKAARIELQSNRAET